MIAISNHVILWSTLILPWATLFFMKKEDLKRFMPVGLFTAFTSIIIHEVLINLNLMSTLETLYPLNQILPMFCGGFPVVSMWIFKFTYGRLWLYLLTNAIADIGFAYFLLPWLASKGIMSIYSSTIVYLVTCGHQIVLYAYHTWQQGVFISSERKSFSPSLQPAAAKPLPKDHEK